MTNTRPKPENLLGLIYNEIGEVGAALTQWVISLKPAGAGQSGGGISAKGPCRERDIWSWQIRPPRSIIQALILSPRMTTRIWQALLLMRMVEEFPQYVKAQELLALLYLHQEDYIKAGTVPVSGIERLTVTTHGHSAYMDIAKHNTGKG